MKPTFAILFYFQNGLKNKKFKKSRFALQLEKLILLFPKPNDGSLNGLSVTTDTASIKLVLRNMRLTFLIRSFFLRNSGPLGCQDLDIA